MIIYNGRAASEPDVTRMRDELFATSTILGEPTEGDESQRPTVRRVKVAGLSAIEEAIEKCEQQIELQTDRLMRQTKAGIDPTHSRKLLFFYHSSLIALERSRQALQKQQNLRAQFWAR